MNQPMSACSWVTLSSGKWNRGTVVRCPLVSITVPASGPVPVTTVPAASISAVTATSSPASTRRSVRTSDGTGPSPLAEPHVQHDRGREDRRRQQVVHGDQGRVELGEHHDPADHRLGDDAERQRRRQPHQVRRSLAVGPVLRRQAMNVSPAIDDKREVQQPVAELDRRVQRRLPGAVRGQALVLVHVGQSGQPSPDELSRTASPVEMRTALEMTAASANPRTAAWSGRSRGALIRVSREDTRPMVTRAPVR